MSLAQGLLHRRDVAPAGRRQALGVEDGERPHPSGLPVAGALDRVVDGRVDVVAHEVRAHLAAALERDVGELQPQRLLELNRDDLVFLGRPGAAHGEGLPVLALLHGVDVLLGALVRRLRVHPEDELVERQPRDGRQVLPVERHAGVKRRREEIRQRDDDRVGVTGLPLHVREALGARAARLVHHDQGPRRELVLLHQGRDQARHLVRASSRSGGYDELDRLGRLPRLRRGDERGQQGQAENAHGAPQDSVAHVRASRIGGFAKKGRQRSLAASSDPRRRRCVIWSVMLSKSRRHRDVGQAPCGTTRRPESPSSPTSRRPWPGSTRGPPR